MKQQKDNYESVSRSVSLSLWFNNTYASLVLKTLSYFIIILKLRPNYI